MGEQHPASKKVVLEFCPSDIPDLTPEQTTKLIKLAGPRYNPALQRIKMSCESFETQAQNKRYLGDLVYKLLKTAKDESTDGFEDMPVDERHIKKKTYHQFPERWKVTPQRKMELEERRAKELEGEASRRQAGNLVDGAEVIQNALERLGMREMVEERAKGRLGGGAAKVVKGRPGPGAKSTFFK
jgi:small subunit ribosomal protein S35